MNSKRLAIVRVLVAIALCAQIGVGDFAARAQGLVGRHKRKPGQPAPASIGGMADDGLAHVPTNYNSFTPPSKGSTYFDDFGTTIRKVSDYDDLNDSLVQEYSPHSAFNVDSTYLLLINAIGGGYRVVNPTTGAIITDPGISGSSEAYWSVTDPDLFYYKTGNQIKSFRVSNTTHTTVATFNGTGGKPSCTSIAFGGGDVDVSEDGDHIPVFCDDSKYGIYQFSTGNFTASPIDFSATNENVLWCAATPDNNALCRLNTTRTLAGTSSITNDSNVVTGSGSSFLTEVTRGAFVTISGQRRYVTNVTSNTSMTVDSNFTTSASGQSVSYAARMILYDKHFNFLRGIAPFGGHASAGRDTDGSEILLIDGANNPGTPPTGCANNGIYKYKLSDGSVSCLFGLPDFNLTGHLSFSNHRGHNYALISYYDGRTDPATATAMLSTVLRGDWDAVGVWKKYYNEAILIKVDGTEARRMAHLRTRVTAFGVPGGSPATQSHYWFSSRANLSKSVGAHGYPAYFIFASNMNSNLRHRALTGTVSTTDGSRNFTGSGTNFTDGSGQTTIGGEITVNGQTRIIDQQSSDTAGRVTSNFTATNTNVSATAWHPDSGVESFVGTIDAPLTDFTAPVISSISSGTPGATSATITWSTNEAATSQVEWGTTTYYGGGISAFETNKVSSHSVNLTGLTAATTFHYRVKSRDAAGNISLSSDQTFTTGGADTTAPAISSVSAGSLTTTGATITWTTDEAADSQVEYGATTSYGSSTTLNTSLVTSHSEAITGLSAGTLYHYRVKSKDASNNLATSADFTFTTSSASDFVTDSFTEASDTTLASHTGATGATWAKHPAAAYVSTATVDAATDRVFPLGTTAYYTSGTPPSADYYVQADFFAASIISVNAAICARMDTSADTMYLVRLNNGATWELRKIVAGTATTLATSTNQLPTAGNSKTVKLVVTGTSLTVVINGTTEITATDSAITAAGKAGVRFSGAASASTGFHLDNFSAR